MMNTNKSPVAGPSTNRVTGRFGRATAVLSVLAMVGALSVLTAPSASAAPLTNLSWTVSNNQISATPVTYSYAFRTATTGIIKTIEFVASCAGLAGTPVIVKNYGIKAGGVARSGQTITYTVGSAAAVASGTPIYVEISGLTNSGTAGSCTTAITTKLTAGTTIDGGTNTNAVTLAAINTAVTVTISKSSTFTIDTEAFELAMDPSLPALADQSQTVGLTVLTNANSGYTLTVGDTTGLRGTGAGNPVIADVSANKAASAVWPGVNKFGYTVTATGATVDAAFSGSKYAGYVATGEQVASRATSTGATADTISIINRVAIDYDAPSGDFTDTVTYTMTPNYT